MLNASASYALWLRERQAVWQTRRQFLRRYILHQSPYDAAEKVSALRDIVLSLPFAPAVRDWLLGKTQTPCPIDKLTESDHQALSFFMQPEALEALLTLWRQTEIAQMRAKADWESWQKDGLERFLLEVLRDALTDLEAKLKELDALRTTYEKKMTDFPRPPCVFVTPAVTVRRTAPNARKGVGRGSNRNKDPCDGDGDGGGDEDGDSGSLCCLLNTIKRESPRAERGQTPLEVCLYAHRNQF